MNDERKRGREQEDSKEDRIDSDTYSIFRKSKRTLRSPEQRKLGEERKGKEKQHKYKTDVEEIEKMEELKEMIKEMMKEMKKNADELKEEIKEIKHEMRRKEEKWDEEKCQLMKRIETLEFKAEKEEKQKRKNNIIIRGITVEENQVPKGVQDFLSKTLQIEMKIERAYIINKDKHDQIIRAELESWGKKQEIMKNKSNLKNTKIYIDNDLTNEERFIQREIRSIAKEEKGKGNKVKIGYQKIIISGVEYKWNKEANGVQAAGILRSDPKN